MIIGIERDDGGLSVMTLVDDIQDVEAIDREVARWADGSPWKCVRWEAIDDYPPRENRNAYELGRFSAVLNEAKIEARKPTAEERLAALERAILPAATTEDRR
jgi:hypothetical protein